MKLVAGGVVGGALGVWLSTRLAGRRRVLERAFAGMLFAVAAYVAIQAGLALAARPAEPLSMERSNQDGVAGGQVRAWHVRVDQAAGIGDGFAKEVAD